MGTGGDTTTRVALLPRSPSTRRRWVPEHGGTVGGSNDAGSRKTDGAPRPAGRNPVRRFPSAVDAQVLPSPLDPLPQHTRPPRRVVRVAGLRRQGVARRARRGRRRPLGDPVRGGPAPRRCRGLGHPPRAGPPAGAGPGPRPARGLARRPAAARGRGPAPGGAGRQGRRGRRPAHRALAPVRAGGARPRHPVGGVPAARVRHRRPRHPVGLRADRPTGRARARSCSSRWPRRPRWPWRPCSAPST